MAKDRDIHITVGKNDNVVVHRESESSDPMRPVAEAIVKTVDSVANWISSHDPRAKKEDD